MSFDMEHNLEQAKMYIESKDFDSARTCLLDILKQDNENQAALMMLGGEYFRSGKLSEAEMIFERLILAEPGKGQFSIALFNTLWKMERHEEAFEEIKRFMDHANQEEEAETIKQYIALTESISGPL